MKASEWAFDRIKEASEKVAQDEAEKVVSIVQEIMLTSTDNVRRIIAPVGGQGGVTMSVPALQQFPLGRLRVVGLWEKTYQVVIRNLWREVRLEATNEAFSRASM